MEAVKYLQTYHHDTRRKDAITIAVLKAFSKNYELVSIEAEEQQNFFHERYDTFVTLGVTRATKQK